MSFLPTQLSDTLSDGMGPIKTKNPVGISIWDGIFYVKFQYGMAFSPLAEDCLLGCSKQCRTGKDLPQSLQRDGNNRLHLYKVQWSGGHLSFEV